VATGGARSSVVILADFKGPEGGGFVPCHVRTAQDVRRALGLDVHFIFPEEARGAQFLADVADAGFMTSFIDRHDRPLRRTMRLRRVLNERSARIVHSHFSRFDLDTGVAGRSSGAKVIWHVHNSLLGYSGRQRAKDLLKVRIASGLCDVVIANSEQTYRESVRRSFPESKVEIVLNGLATNRFTPVPGAREAVRRELELPPDGFVFLGFPWNPVIKGADLLVRAVDALARSDVRPRPTLVVTGGERLLAAAERTLGGHCPPWLRIIKPVDDVARLYAAADVFVSASRTDAFSVAIGEAMASGLPVISSDIPGPAHFFSAPGCVTFPSEDWPALASAMVHMMQRNDIKAIGEANRAFAQRFDMSHYARRTVELYERLLRGGTVAGGPPLGRCASVDPTRTAPPGT
jgi:glycosyltransferase involved in cell wall biosynthesis